MNTRKREDSTEVEVEQTIRLFKKLGSKPYMALIVLLLGGGSLLGYFGIATTDEVKAVSTALEEQKKTVDENTATVQRMVEAQDELSKDVKRALEAAEAQRQVNQLQKHNSELQVNIMKFEIKKIDERVEKLERRRR